MPSLGQFRKINEHIMSIDEKYSLHKQVLGDPVDQVRQFFAGKYRLYRNGAIYWTPELGAYEVHGSILSKWEGVGGVTGTLKFPLTDVIITPTVAYSMFIGGLIMALPGGDTFIVGAPLHTKYAGLGLASGVLGPPISDTRANGPGGALICDFRYGTLAWNGRDAIDVHLTPEGACLRNDPCEERGLTNVLEGYQHQWAPAGSHGVDIGEGTVTKSFVSHEDWPFNHNSHDWNFDVELDEPYYGLYGCQNVIGRRPEMECEWEVAYFPPEFFPFPGDRVWMAGRWVFDCSHTHTTEIHPPYAVAFTRSEPQILSQGSDPVPGTKTAVYVCGQGGYVSSNAAYQDWEFDIHVPPKPSSNSHLRVLEPADLPYGGPSPRWNVVEAENRVHVTYPLSGQGGQGSYPRFGAVIKTAWESTPLTTCYRKLHITLESAKIKDDGDPFFSGEWKVWALAGNRWFPLNGNDGGKLDDIDDGETATLRNCNTDIIVPVNGGFDITTTGWESDGADDVMGVNDPLIDVFQGYVDYAAGHGIITGNPIPAYVPGLTEIAGITLAMAYGDQNDRIGEVHEHYSYRNGFGIGRQTAWALLDQPWDLTFKIEELARWRGPGTKVQVKFTSIKFVDEDQNRTNRSVAGSVGFQVNDRHATLQNFSASLGQETRIGLNPLTVEICGEDVTVQVLAIDRNRYVPPSIGAGGGTGSGGRSGERRGGGVFHHPFNVNPSPLTLTRVYREADSFGGGTPHREASEPAQPGDQHHYGKEYIEVAYEITVTPPGSVTGGTDIQRHGNGSR